MGRSPGGSAPPDPAATSSQPDGTVTGRFRLDPLAGRAFTTALEDIIQRLWREDHEAGSTRTAAQRRADAFVELIVNGAAQSRQPGASSALIHIVMSQTVADDLFRGCILRPPTPTMSTVAASSSTARRSTPHWAVGGTMGIAQFPPPPLRS